MALPRKNIVPLYQIERPIGPEAALPPASPAAEAGIQGQFTQGLASLKYALEKQPHAWRKKQKTTGPRPARR